MKHLLWVAGLVTLVPSVYFLSKYTQAASGQGRNDAVFGIGLLIISVAMFAIFFFIRFEEEGKEDISIRPH